MLQWIAGRLVLAEEVLVVAALGEDVMTRALLVGRIRADGVGVPLQLARQPRVGAAEFDLRQPLRPLRRALVEGARSGAVAGQHRLDRLGVAVPVGVAERDRGARRERDRAL